MVYSSVCLTGLPGVDIFLDCVTLDKTNQKQIKAEAFC